MTLYPLFFHPVFKERIWGGRRLAELYKKPLPSGKKIGESWEIVDRAEDNSVVANGPLAGGTLESIVRRYRDELLGDGTGPVERFPLLVKILDAREKLSLQVHPPASKAEALGGEPKTEMWYVADAEPDADLFVGLKRGVTRDEFEAGLREGRVQERFHRILVKKGDAMFLPSGRVHALGGGNVIFEAQQNSDTTYRVFDWNRLEANGKPRELHIEKSLESIAFDDFEPELLPKTVHQGADGRRVRPLVNDPLFRAEVIELEPGQESVKPAGGWRIYGVAEGAARVESSAGVWGAPAGTFCLVPAAAQDVRIQAVAPSKILAIAPGGTGESPA
jgi:mannose-6-phosphate isomerase